jgi:hypothetical protein
MTRTELAWIRPPSLCPRVLGNCAVVSIQSWRPNAHAFAPPRTPLPLTDMQLRPLQGLIKRSRPPAESARNGAS